MAFGLATAGNAGDIIMPAKALRSDHSRERDGARLPSTAAAMLPLAAISRTEGRHGGRTQPEGDVPYQPVRDELWR